MPRASRYWVKGAAYHLTHRCHNRDFLLRFARDRDDYRAMLRQELQRRSVSLLSYAITSNHVHLLVTAEYAQDIAGLMQSVQGRFAETYNRRRGRQGAFWSDRYHATQIDSGDHLWACLKYIDLNMVRAGVVKHPREWSWTAWHELTGSRVRNRLVDREALLKRLEGVTWPGFQEHYGRLVDEVVMRNEGLGRDARWTESIAVGQPAFVARVEAELMVNDRRRRLERMQTPDGAWVLREHGEVYGQRVGNRAEKGLEETEIGCFVM